MDYSKALELGGYKKWSIHGNKYTGIVWHETPDHVPTKSELETLYNNWKANNDADKRREAEYINKGWKNSFDLIDDILERGIEAVKVDRDAIKAAHPKT